MDFKIDDKKSKIINTEAPETFDKRFSIGDVPFTRVNVIVNAEGQQEVSFLQNIFPILLMTTLAVIVFWLPKITAMTKIELTAVFLISIVFFTQLAQITNNFVTYYTSYDTVILSSYIIFLISIIVQARRIYIERTSNDETKISENKASGRIVMIIAIAILLAVSVIDYLRPT